MPATPIAASSESSEARMQAPGHDDVPERHGVPPMGGVTHVHPSAVQAWLVAQG